MTIWLAGIDIGGTKCAASLGKAENGRLDIVDKAVFLTPPSPQLCLERLITELDGLLAAHAAARPQAIGISCGGPLNSRTGHILSPPNLPGWDNIDALTPFKERYGDVPVSLQNDANACALAEWQWGAGRGCRHMVFLTFGTGMGAGLILNGQLYEGASGLAGEIGHVRMEEGGSWGYGKAGSFEGFCSGGGIARMAMERAAILLGQGRRPRYCPEPGLIASITAQTVAEAARLGDADALDIFRVAGKQLGRGLAMLADILNPERVVIGSIYERQQALLETVAREELLREALPVTAADCSVVPADLGDMIGDYAALSVAQYAFSHSKEDF